MCFFNKKKDKPCLHPFWGAIDVEGYQYCVKCNEARFVPKQVVPCSHKWEYNEEKHIMTCLLCGEIKCFHHWSTNSKDVTRVFGTKVDGSQSDLPLALLRRYTCDYCGEVKEVKEGSL